MEAFQITSYYNLNYFLININYTAKSKKIKQASLSVARVSVAWLVGDLECSGLGSAKFSKFLFSFYSS